MAEKMLNSFDIQDSIADDDIVLGYDKSENKVKNFKFGTGIWDWIVDKMANAVVSKLTTTDKTVLGAINELNSNLSKIVYVDGGEYDYNTYTPQMAAQDIIDTKLHSDPSLIQFVTFVNGSNLSMIVQKNSNEYASYILFSYSLPRFVYNRKVIGWGDI